MKISIPTAGKYVVAVSGGVDSVVLLDVLVRQPALQLVVVTIDHGWRGEDSAADTRFVETLSKKYECETVVTTLTLANKSEATARAARWNVLHAAKKEHGAKAIITAHHQDDVLETMIINLKRGTGRTGLSSLKETGDIRRPLINCSKREIYNYALSHNLEWVEDPSNQDMRYTRNLVRHSLIPQLSDSKKNTLLKINQTMLKLNPVIDGELRKWADSMLGPNGTFVVEREWFRTLSESVQFELVRWIALSLKSETELTSAAYTRAVVGITSALPSKITELGGKIEVVHSKNESVVRKISTHRMKVLK